MYASARRSTLIRAGQLCAPERESPALRGLSRLLACALLRCFLEQVARRAGGREVLGNGFAALIERRDVVAMGVGDAFPAILTGEVVSPENLLP